MFFTKILAIFIQNLLTEDDEYWILILNLDVLVAEYLYKSTFVSVIRLDMLTFIMKGMFWSLQKDD